MLVICNNLQNFIRNRLENVNCEENTKAYIVSIFDRFKKQDIDYSKESITILYGSAMSERDFEKFQNIGDWIFFCKTIHPKYEINLSDYYSNIAKFSYYSCFKILNKKWLVYENLADDFNYLTKETRKSIFTHRV